MDFNALWRDAVRSFEVRGYQPTQVDQEKRIIGLHLWGGNAAYRIFLRIEERFETLTAIFFYPVKIPPERQQATVELLNSLNLKAFVGKFMFDGEDGEVHYRMTLPLAGGAEFEGFLGKVMDWGFHDVDQHHSAIMATAFRDGESVQTDPEVQAPRLEVVKGNLH